MNSITMPSRFLSVATLGLLFALAAAASPIFVSNFSFETLPVGGLPNGCGGGCAFSTGAIPGWSGSNANSGQFQPGVQVSNFSVFNSVPDGITVAYSNSPTLFQTVIPTVQLGVTYTLLVDLGHRKDTAFLSSADLLINGVTTTATGVAPTAGNWATFTATYVGLLADVGKSITIELRTAGAQGDFDNVRLSDSTQAGVPEPASVTLLGLALAGVTVFARRKRVR
jgi:hypothetical protein